MRKAKGWLCGVGLMAMLCGGVQLTLSRPAAGAAEEKVIRDHWQHHDGHWSYWHEGDKRWYYTDGTHWYYRDGDAWKVYRFDKGFGRGGFERGEYRPPEEGAKIVVPRHDVFRRR